MMEYQIEKVEASEYEELVELWEASVRATHHFLKEEDIQYFRPLILNTYLDAVSLRCVKNENGKILGFLGVADHNLEMLFIHPEYRSKGVGKVLLKYAIDEMKVRKVDVNEQNPQAIGFYQYQGFVTKGRSEQDGSGKPYPILHMVLDQ